MHIDRRSGGVRYHVCGADPVRRQLDPRRREGGLFRTGADVQKWVPRPE